MSNAIVESGRENAAPLSVESIRAQVNLIQEVMRGVMQKDQHYGIIPGCKKPSLLKPGAEKLSMTFRLRPIINEDRDVKIREYESGHREITVYCHIFNVEGVELATGVGSCSTMESKYRYRGGEKKSLGFPVPKEYWNLKKEGKMDDAMAAIGGPGHGVMKGESGWEVCEMGAKEENPDIADTYNTVLKMAKKRAYVDGILSATGASDIFTQDVEDMPEVAAAAGSPAAEGAPATSSENKEKLPDGLREMNAAFEGKCSICGEAVKKGAEIIYDSKAKKAAHKGCWKASQEPTEGSETEFGKKDK